MPLMRFSDFDAYCLWNTIPYSNISKDDDLDTGMQGAKLKSIYLWNTSLKIFDFPHLTPG